MPANVFARRLKSRTLRRRLAWLIICVVGLAVTPIAGISAWRDGEREVSVETTRLSTRAAAIASLASEAADRSDEQAAFHALRSIGQMPDVEYGRIEGAAGRLLVEAGAGVRLTSDVRAGGSSGNGSLLTRLFSQSSEVSVPIVYDARDVGRVVLLGRTDGMLKRFLVSFGESLAVAAMAVLIGLLIAWRLQEGIARPILALTDAMRGVQQTHDFDRNVTIQADGELEELVGGFNSMLSEIRVRDGRIAAQVAGLESEVAARTAELVVAKDAAEAANSAKSDFLATISHEIRTPMNGVMVMAEMLAAGNLPPREQRFAGVIAKSGASLLAIINDILDFSKMEAGKLELESVSIELSEIVDDVLSLFWDRAASKGLDLAGFVDPATPRAIAGDPVRLRQVISNLVNNAIKFTESGGVLVEIAPEGEGAVRIAVQDTGIGIPQDKIASLFGAFTQADQSTTRRYGGTGLGLAISKRLVDAMGGDFRVTSTVGQGSSFGFVFPTPFLEPAAPWPQPAERGTAVIVEHSGVFTRRVLTSYFQRAGYLVTGDMDATIAVGSPAGIRTLANPPPIMICVGTYGESEPQELVRRGVVQAVLTQPLRRQEVALLLRRLQTGTALDNISDPGSQHQNQALPSFVGSRVLVADDSPVNREVAMEALQRLGIEAKVTADGRAAVAAASAEHFDAVLMDGSMPEMSGYDAAREIRRVEQEQGRERLPIVALTAHVIGAAADAWQDAGMDAVLHKPFTLKALAETLSRFLAQSAEQAVPSAPVVPSVSSVSCELSTVRQRIDLFDPEVVAQLETFATNGRNDFVEKVIRLYNENAPGCITDLRASAQSGDANGVAGAAHALKSMSYNIGAKAVAAAAAQIETVALTGTIPDSAATDQLAGSLLDTLYALGFGAPRGEAVQAIGSDPEAAAMLHDLKSAIVNGELFLLYQPQFDPSGQVLMGCETLVRWTHPRLGPVSPSIFIPLAEEHGLIGEITDLVLCQAMTETKDVALPIAVNASAHDFASPDFVPRIRRALARTGFDPRRLEVEVTETAILANEQQVRQNMEELRQAGVTIALDDFGAGYANLQHVRRFPFDRLKLDRELIADCSRDVQAATLVHAMVSIGRALGMQVTAEGVETERDWQFLKIAGVHAMQGWLFSKPLRFTELFTLIGCKATPSSSHAA